MAVRTPLYFVSGNLREMDAGMITDLQNLAIYEYAQNPSVTLSVSGSSGNLTSINDTRLQAGSSLTNVSTFPSEAATAEPSTVTVSYQRILKTAATVTATVDTGKTFPLYYNSAGNLQHMNATDFIDTFIAPAITTLTSGSTTTSQGGTYLVSTSTSVAGAALVSATPIFTDTRADTSLYSAAGIPEDLDQPQTITNYYLHQITGPTEPTLTTFPLYADSNNNIKEYSQAEIASVLASYIRREAASSVLANSIDYNFDGPGTARGSSIANTILIGGAGNYQTFQAGADDYRAQEFPDGSPSTANTYIFKINKV
jgi:hypothetical protein